MRPRPLLHLVALSLALGQAPACGGSQAPPPARVATSPGFLEGSHGVTDKGLADLMGTHWDWSLADAPVYATMMGDHRFDDKIDDNSLEGLRAHRRVVRTFLGQARGIPRDRLSETDRVTLDLFVEALETSIETEVCLFEEWAVSVANNPVERWNDLPQHHAVKSARDAQHLLARYRAIPASIDHDIEHLRRGLAAGRVASAESLRRTLALVKGQLAQPLDAWPLLEPAKGGAPYAAELRAAVETGIKPAYARYATLVERELLPRGRRGGQVGLSGLSGGDACYVAQIREATGLRRSAEELHQLGVTEMAKVHAEMRVLAKRLFGTDDLKVVFQKLRTDRALRFQTAQEIEAKANASVAAARAVLPRFFGILPRAQVVVRRVPDYQAEYTTIAYYQQPHPDGSKPGEYFVNVLHPETRPRFEAAALAFHESIPGHHLQIAIAQELRDLPAFRRHVAGVTAFVEGWALYCERLAEEMGLYASDLDRMGMLSYESWRAARLVVDTGLHAMGWPRERAVRYMVENTPLAENNIGNEVDRYIGWPGQAVAYKVGQLEIFRLRREAQAALGDRFDVRGFHDAVLGAGAVTLGVMADQVRAWVERRKAAAPRSSATRNRAAAPRTRPPGAAAQPPPSQEE